MGRLDARMARYVDNVHSASLMGTRSARHGWDDPAVKKGQFAAMAPLCSSLLLRTERPVHSVCSKYDCPPVRGILRCGTGGNNGRCRDRVSFTVVRSSQHEMESHWPCHGGGDLCFPS